MIRHGRRLDPRPRAVYQLGATFHIRAPTQSGLTVNQKTLEKPRTKTKPKTQRPPLWKGDPAQRRLYAARIRGSCAQGYFPDEREPCLQGDDDGASARGLCDSESIRATWPRRRRKIATEMGRARGFLRSTSRPKGRIGVKNPAPVTFAFKTNANLSDRGRLPAGRPNGILLAN